MIKQEEIVAAASTRTLLDTIASIPHDDGDHLAAALAELHNDGRLDVLTVFRSDQLTAFAGHSFFRLQHVFCQTLPRIRCPVADAAATCKVLFVLFTPIKDNQAIDINIACLFLNRVGSNSVIHEWIGKTAEATMFAFRFHGRYPCIYNEYRDLIDHPRHDNDYRVEATAGSLLVPTLAVWAAVTADATTLGMLADFVAGPYAHSTLQLWYPGFDTETHLYRGSGAHGLAATGIDIQRSCEAMLSPIKSECEASEAFASLSAVRAGLWPLVILASRHHRVPVPPQFWRPGESINE